MSDPGPFATAMLIVFGAFVVTGLGALYFHYGYKAVDKLTWRIGYPEEWTDDEVREFMKWEEEQGLRR